MKKWVYKSEDDQLNHLRQAVDPILDDNTVILDPVSLIYDDEEKSKSRISDMLLCLEINSDDMEWMVSTVVDRTSDELASLDDDLGNKSWLMSVEVQIITLTLLQKNECRDDDHVKRLIREYERGSHGMVPTSMPSIVTLEKLVLVDDVGETMCAICLQDLQVGLQVSRMPCNHVFHNSCIVRWLNKSHYCPTCRYEMPT